MITVMTWLWRQRGGRADYRAEHVNIWAAMIRRHLAMPHRLACVTDMADGIDEDIDIIPPPREFEDWRIPSWGPSRPQCLRRIALFAPDAADRFGERFVSMDLDCVVSGPLDPLFETAADFRIMRGTAQGRPYNGSMLMMQAGARTQVYETFTPAGAKEAGRRFIGSDQAWISYCLGPREATWGAADGVRWWGDRSPKGAAEARITFFPGGTKPWAVIGREQFVQRHYRGRRDGRCLVLGYAPTVWEEASAALEAGPFDAVIASPEAAEHWPAPILAEAETDVEAEMLARMHGFDDIVFCGRSQDSAS